MKFFTSALFFLTILFSTSSCVNKKNNSDNNTVSIDTTINNTNDSNVTVPLEFYKRFEGTIAGEPVFLQMSSLRKNISGIYYYENIGVPVYFSAININGDSLFLIEKLLSGKYTDNDKFATLNLKFTDSVLSGIWQSADRIRSFPVLLKESYPQGSFKFSISTIEDSVKPYPKFEGGPLATAKITFVYPDSSINKTKSDFLKSEIEALMGYDKVSPNTPVEDVAHKFIFDYFFRYKNGLPAPSDTSADLSSPTFKHYYDKKIGVVFNRKNMVIFSSYILEFAGGAHPNHSTTFFCVDVENKKRLALADVLIMDSAKISPILEKVLRKDRKIPSSNKLSTVLFEDYILPNENFYFNLMGIVFYYNPYEIAPYVYGDTEIFIPFSSISDLLKPEFKERMGIK